MSQIYTIYKATNIITNEVYIGYTVNFHKRLKQHKNSMTNKFKQTVFRDKLVQYGWNNFVWEILYQSKDQDHTLNVMEPYFIKEYNSCIEFENSNGYNMTIGGESGTGTPKEYICISPEGITHKIKNLRKFAAENNLGDGSQLVRSSKGKIKSHKGWKVYPVQEEDILKRKEYLYNKLVNRKYYLFSNINGYKCITNSLTQFCNQFNLDIIGKGNRFLRMAKGSSKRKDYLGWTCKYITLHEYINLTSTLPDANRVYANDKFTFDLTEYIALMDNKIVT